MSHSIDAAMVRYKMVPYPPQPELVWISGRKLAAIVPREVAEAFEELVRRARPRGWWQLKILLQLAKHGIVPADAARWVRGRAAAYRGRYQASLDAVMARAGARYIPGLRGGRWTAHYLLPCDLFTDGK
jgi:hypothetical protein